MPNGVQWIEAHAKATRITVQLGTNGFRVEEEAYPVALASLGECPSGILVYWFDDRRGMLHG
jgi:hypothetical protein